MARGTPVERLLKEHVDMERHTDLRPLPGSPSATREVGGAACDSLFLHRQEFKPKDLCEKILQVCFQSISS